MEDIKCQTLLVLLGLVIAVLNIIKAVLGIVEKIIDLAAKKEKRRPSNRGKRRR